MAPKNEIPKRWSSYKAFGEVIQGTRIICFKVPLKKRIQKKGRVRKIWNIKTLLKTIPKLGAIIDLTNANGYYDPTKLAKRGVLHKKIKMSGHVIPPNNIVEEFQDAVDGFLKHNKDSLVGVHCRLGLNRTGYMVCRYMRDRLNIPAREAIRKFQVARGYIIEKQYYIAHLISQPPHPDLGRHAIV